MRPRSMPSLPTRRHSSFMANAAKSESDKIDAAIADERRLRKLLKSVLVMGGQNSGKATFMKQARAFSSGFGTVERDEYKCAIHSSILDTARTVLNDPTVISANTDICDSITSFVQATYNKEVPRSQLFIALLVLWADPRIQAHIRSSPNLPPDGSFLYFLDSLLRISEHSYNPTDAEIIRFKLPSPAITETPFDVQITYAHSEYQLQTILTCVRHDIGLQRKWFSFFIEAEAIVFLVDLSSYDEAIVSQDTEDSVNAMREAMIQFQTTGSPWSTIMLIMNKVDLFASRLSACPLTTCFPEYQGANTAGAATDYCIARFLSPLPERLNARAWCTNAIDVNLMSGVLQEIGEFISAHSIRTSDCRF
ncbi:Heterotrimeric G protein alpha subunit B [Mycena venus]|uniref:Heterotrimeric G protein alpha subunit B n=1 Tax=Mycena venus TaxID=2733690 RepID=A0A8H7DD33_9AGAR|nr:Heterotrimeric G protein alpha subunit B [Mycena venus]